ncbi:MAG: nucleotide pyrophosphohydrolase [Spirochaetia bacterium]|nr:nucleotide pyrophosphohydrolase [Spirochaetia bacterium]
MEIKNIQRSVQDFVTEREWDRYHTPKNIAIALSVEVSELLELFQWMSDQEISEIDRSDRKFTRIKEEFADSMIYLLRFADLLDIDIEQAIYDKLQKNAEKYPVALSKGDFVKYNERDSDHDPIQ